MLTSMKATMAYTKPMRKRPWSKGSPPSSWGARNSFWVTASAEYPAKAAACCSSSAPAAASLALRKAERPKEAILAASVPLTLLSSPVQARIRQPPS